ncbi:hypothetical protein AVEN_197821-1 [Araneus ventricosus]|uniref:Uncharacterized protein n=1 Tax=Araneus ventricosus TaxID=182803 RepID=A0A4Y2PG78_ARAVE|nr:hypothetical protein AVEN_197821-1 [Araneus ventricosus]
MGKREELILGKSRGLLRSVEKREAHLKWVAHCRPFFLDDQDHVFRSLESTTADSIMGEIANAFLNARYKLDNLLSAVKPTPATLKTKSPFDPRRKKWSTKYVVCCL